MNNWETKVLSPHEFATLMLVRSAPEQIDMSRAELDTLLERQLVELEELAEGHRRPMLTPTGQSLLAAASRLETIRTPPPLHAGAQDTL